MRDKEADSWWIWVPETALQAEALSFSGMKAVSPLSLSFTPHMFLMLSQGVGAKEMQVPASQG